jgi:hypothetical protein
VIVLSWTLLFVMSWDKLVFTLIVRMPGRGGNWRWTFRAKIHPNVRWRPILIGKRS